MFGDFESQKLGSDHSLVVKLNSTLTHPQHFLPGGTRKAWWARVSITEPPAPTQGEAEELI